MEQANDAINEAIKLESVELLLSALRRPAAQLPPVLTFAGALYMEDLSRIRAMKREDLLHEDMGPVLTGI